MSFKPRSKNVLIVDIDSNIHESLLRLGDHVPAYERNQFIQYIASILLMSLLLNDRDEAIDAFERISSLAHIAHQKVHGILWGEFISLMNSFHTHYYHHDGLIIDLEDVLETGSKEFLELMFEVEIPAKASYLKVS